MSKTYWLQGSWSATRLYDALTLARERQFDFAVLDINLAGEMSFPVADVLRERKIPFMFSGYTSGRVAEEYRNELRLRKPFRTTEMARAIERGWAAALEPYAGNGSGSQLDAPEVANAHS